MQAPGQPSVVYGLRGIAYMEMKVLGPDRDLHSGTYGGVVVNPLNALARILAPSRTQPPAALPSRLLRRRASVARMERREIAALPSTRGLPRDLGVAVLAGERDFTPLERATVCRRSTSRHLRRLPELRRQRCAGLGGRQGVDASVPDQ